MALIGKNGVRERFAPHAESGNLSMIFRETALTEHLKAVVIVVARRVTERHAHSVPQERAFGIDGPEPQDPRFSA